MRDFMSYSSLKNRIVVVAGSWSWTSESIGSGKKQGNLFSRRGCRSHHRLEKLISFTPFSFNFATTSGSVSSRNSFARDARRRVLTPSSSASS